MCISGSGSGSSYYHQHARVTVTPESPAEKRTLLVVADRRTVLHHSFPQLPAAGSATWTQTSTAVLPLNTSTSTAPEPAAAAPRPPAGLSSVDLYVLVGGSLVIAFFLGLIAAVAWKTCRRPRAASCSGSRAKSGVRWGPKRARCHGGGGGSGGSLICGDVTPERRRRAEAGVAQTARTKTTTTTTPPPEHEHKYGGLDTATMRSPSPKRFRQYEIGGVPATASDRSIRPSVLSVASQARRPSPLCQVYSASAPAVSLPSLATSESEVNCDRVSTMPLSYSCSALSLSSGASAPYGGNCFGHDLALETDSDNDDGSGFGSSARSGLVNRALNEELPLSEPSRRMLIDRCDVDDPFLLSFDCGGVKAMAVSESVMTCSSASRYSTDLDSPSELRAGSESSEGGGGRDHDAVQVGVYSTSANGWTIASEIMQEDIGVALW
ncbi:hypothetical protein BU17DRAFT_70579 [Hysterangium stoloniferum]|nr:hypothetical protein BU17DRAFT_70579 [Hysterangium stoloniferum]